MKPKEVVQSETTDSKWALADLSMAKLHWAKQLTLISEVGRRDANPTGHK